MKEMLAVKLLWGIIIIAAAYFVWNMAYKNYEHFEDSGDVYQNIIRIYYTQLNRSPTTEELRTHSTAITENEYDYDELELRIINSDEYQRLIKTQTDMILPETSRIIEEKELIDRIVRVYTRVRGTEPPTEMYLPLKDLYIYFNYNLYKFVAFLRDSKYLQFEDDVLRDTRLTKDSLIEKYQRSFDDSKLNYDASAIQEIDNTLEEGKRISDLLLSEEPISTDSTDKSKVDTIAMLSFFLSNIKEEQERAKRLEEEERLRQLQEASKNLENQRKLLATATSTQTGCTSSQRVYLPEESKIVNTEYGFRQIQKTPPVCIPVGKPNEIPEIIIYKGLQGTNIDESMDTQVGSIMPKFEYVRYIDIDVPGTTIKPKE